MLINKNVEQYMTFSKLDGKPEKGERKMADEQVLLISDIIENFITSKSATVEEQLSLDVFKICFLEYAF